MSDTSPTNGSMITAEPAGNQAGSVGVYGEHLTGNGQSSWSGLVNVRQRTHGPFSQTASIAQKTKELWHDTTGWKFLSPRRREALDQIASKVARILAGNPDEADHWLDLGGYAELGRDC